MTVEDQRAKIYLFISVPQKIFSFWSICFHSSNWVWCLIYLILCMLGILNCIISKRLWTNKPTAGLDAIPVSNPDWIACAVDEGCDVLQILKKGSFSNSEYIPGDILSFRQFRVSEFSQILLSSLQYHVLSMMEPSAEYDGLFFLSLGGRTFLWI